jgi:hypothetical protein
MKFTEAFLARVEADQTVHFERNTWSNLTGASPPQVGKQYIFLASTEVAVAAIRIPTGQEMAYMPLASILRLMVNVPSESLAESLRILLAEESDLAQHIRRVLASHDPDNTGIDICRSGPDQLEFNPTAFPNGVVPYISPDWKLIALRPVKKKSLAALSPLTVPGLSEASPWNGTSVTVTFRWNPCMEQYEARTDLLSDAPNDVVPIPAFPDAPR